jgi:hypothetical protein
MKTPVCGSFIYVGQTNTGDLFKRLKDHLEDDLAGRWDRFSWFGFKKVKKDNTLSKGAESKWISRQDLVNVLEGIVIEIAEPQMNNQKGRFGDKVELYI